MGSKVLKDAFDRIFPPQILQKHLEECQVSMQLLRKEIKLTAKELRQMYDRASCVGLLRTVCQITYLFILLYLLIYY